MRLKQITWIIIVFSSTLYIANITATKLKKEKNSLKVESNKTVTKDIMLTNNTKEYYSNKVDTKERIELIFNKNCKICHNEDRHFAPLFKQIIPIIKRKTINRNNAINYITNYILTPNPNISITKIKNNSYKMPPMENILTREEANAVASMLYDKYNIDINKILSPFVKTKSNFLFIPTTYATFSSISLAL